MTKLFLRSLLAGWAALGVAGAQTSTPTGPTPTSTPPAASPIAPVVAFKPALPAPNQLDYDRGVVVQVRVLTLPVGNATTKDLFAGERWRVKPNTVALSKKHLAALLEEVAWCRQVNVMHAPKVSHFNRQPMSVRVGDEVAFQTNRGKLSVFVGTKFELKPTIVADGKCVDLAVDFTMTQNSGGQEADIRNLKTLTVKDTYSLPQGETAVVRLGTRTVTQPLNIPSAISSIPYLVRPMMHAEETECEVIALFTIERIHSTEEEPQPSAASPVPTMPMAQLAPPAANAVAPRMMTRAFNVMDIVCTAVSPEAKPEENPVDQTQVFELRCKRLIQVITQTVKPNTWEESGGAGKITYYPIGGTIVVSNTGEVIDEVGNLLDSLHKLPTQLRVPQSAPVAQAIAPRPKVAAVKPSGHVLVQMHLLDVNSDHPAVAKLFGGQREAKLTEAELRTLVQMLKADGSLEVLGRPQLMLTERQTGFFQLGQQFPRLSGATAPGGQSVQQIEYMNIGWVIRMTPDRVVEGKPIKMRLEANLTEPSQTPIDLGHGMKATPIETQAIEATLEVTDGTTMAVNLGTKKRQVRYENKLPIVGDIPYVGRLFRNQGIGHERRDTVIVFTTSYGKSEQHLQQIIGQAAAPIPPALAVACPPATLLATPVPAPATAPPMVRPIGVDGLERIGVDFDRLVPASGTVPPIGAVPGRPLAGQDPLMVAYEAACAAGRKDEAARLALQLLAKDPTCFATPR